MIIYNITCKVDWTVHAQWVPWIKEAYIPEMLYGGLFYHGQLVKLIDTDETDGPTYALQFYARSLENYRLFTADAGTAPLRRFHNKWTQSVVTFGTVMQLVE